MNQIVHIQDIQYDAIKYICSEKATTVKTNVSTISNSYTITIPQTCGKSSSCRGILKQKRCLCSVILF